MKNILTLISLALVLISCNSKKQKAQALFDEKCAACHITPNIDVLPKHLWDKKLLPEVAAKMGILEPGYSPIEGLDYEESKAVINSGVYGELQMISPEEWAILRNYIVEMAPDSLNPTPREAHDFTSIEDFSVNKVSLDNYPGTYISYLALQKDGLYFADLNGGFFKYDYKNDEVSQHNKFDKPVVWYEQLENGEEVYTEIGKLDPTEQILGALWSVDNQGQKAIIKDSLHRPVNSLTVDINADGQLEYIVSEFGHLTGSVSLIDSKGQKTVLWPKPGAIQTEVYDVNQDGLMDIVTLVAQGDEAIMGFIQQKDGSFLPEYLLRFSPIYGTSWFELLDYDGDGDLDLLTVHGDNADKTYTQKPYHGLRISLNDGFGKFEEEFFYQLNGATRVSAADFDEDNDIDIALVSTFPDYENLPEMAFIYLENTGNFEFREQIIEEVSLGRWFLMDKGDIDQDGDLDLMISSFSYVFSPIPQKFQKAWQESGVDMLVLENKLR
ncbi:VCBS repeat-containing protein [Flavobacteriaceae bacterium]|nr:VCBS repeat-containing protein [Flavobacteriaceae bacterium]